MYATNGAVERARWAVMWVYLTGRGKKKIARKEFGDDLASAEALHIKALQAGKPYATLCCLNMGFPPPKELRPYTTKKKGRDKRTRKIRIVEITVDPLREKNLVGELWCPRCRTMRKFVLSKSYTVSGINVREPRYICPICKISQRDHNVRRWNPTAVIHMDSSLATRMRPPRANRTRRRARS